jgi:6-phosphofructokinase 2
MKTPEITTFTINPSLDKSTNFAGLIAEQKIRCEAPRYDAGGGGINVSKAIARLGGTSLCVFTSGGSSGEMLESLIAKENLESNVIKTKNWTRENFIAFDKKSNLQYRFGFPGNPISELEERKIIKTIAALKCNYLVISGSLNQNLLTNYYQEIATVAKKNGAKVIVDTSGEPLQKVLETGVYLVKPNIGELAKLLGVEKLEKKDIEIAAKKLIDNQNAEIVVVSLGANGAILVTKDETHLIKAPKIIRKSTVGAGDSMVGGMVWALSHNKPLKEVLQWGVACGSAATMNEGTQLFKAEEARQLFEDLQQ